MPKVSIIIPVYNTEKYISECLESLLMQTLGDFEVICVDNNSTDRSMELVSDYARRDERIKLYHEARQGNAFARNTGLAMAKGEYIGFVDSDDTVEPRYFEVLYGLAKQKDCDMATTTSYIHDGKSWNSYIRQQCREDTDETRALMLFSGGMVWNSVFRKSFLEKYRIRFPEINCIGQDNYFNALAVIYAGHIVYTDQATYDYRLNFDSITQQKRGRRHFGILDIYEELKEQVLQSKFLSEEDKKKWILVLDKVSLVKFERYYSLMEEAAVRREFYCKFVRTFPQLRFKAMKVVARLFARKWLIRHKKLHALYRKLRGLPPADMN